MDITPGLKLKYGLGSGPTPLAGNASASGMGNASDGEVSGGGIEEGFLDIASLKEVALSCREGEFISIARRFGNFLLDSKNCTLNGNLLLPLCPLQVYQHWLRLLGAYRSFTAAT